MQHMDKARAVDSARSQQLVFVGCAVSASMHEFQENLLHGTVLQVALAPHITRSQSHVTPQSPHLHHLYEGSSDDLNDCRLAIPDHPCFVTSLA